MGWIIAIIGACFFIAVTSAIILGPDNKVEKESECVIEVIVDHELDELGNEIERKEESKKD